MDQTEIHPAEMTDGKNVHEEVIQSLTISKIRESAQIAKSFSSACIYRVPRGIREGKESAYTPRIISIGPLHRNCEYLRLRTVRMQHIKMSYTNNLLCRLTIPPIRVLQECVAVMETSLNDARKCYEEEVTLDEEMMLIDGCFILEFLYRFYCINNGLEGLEPDDPIFGNRMTALSVIHDLLLLENQIPFLVLERLFQITVARIPNPPSLSLTDYLFLFFVATVMRPEVGISTNSGSTKTSCSPCDCILLILGNKMNNSKPDEKVPSEEQVQEVPSSSRNASNYNHILHKTHDDHLPRDQTGKGELSEFMPSAAELVYAGVKFVPGTGNDLFDVKFTEPQGPFWWCRSARFEIPSLRIHDWTEPFLRNFIAFEQCSPGISQHFTSYATLMDMLVDSDIDVQVLQKAGVVINWLGSSEDVTNLFNKLCKDVSVQEFRFADTCNRATIYSKRFWPKNMARLRRKYFDSPWTFIAFCLAFIAFGVNIAQFIILCFLK